jgi:phosphoserine aminotransferase
MIYAGAQKNIGPAGVVIVIGTPYIFSNILHYQCTQLFVYQEISC